MLQSSAAPAILAPRQLQAPASRWSMSAWAFVRQGTGSQLAAGAGLLGGSQAGARASYRINDDAARPLALSARFYSPLRSSRGAEAALGVEWKPSSLLPMTFLAERRQAIGRKGRSAFALLAYGGVARRGVAGPLDFEAYAQAGVVGAKSRDLFADGAATLTLAMDESERLKLGAGGWAAAQPGVSRIDVGPHLSYRLPIAERDVRLTAEWRLRVAGDAEPGSGPALTLSTSF